MRHRESDLSSPCAVASASGRLRERAEPSEQRPGANHMASSERMTVTPVTVRTTGAANGTEQPETVQRIRVAGARSKYRPHSLGASPHARSGRALDQCVRVWQYPRLPGARATRNFTVLQANLPVPTSCLNSQPETPMSLARRPRNCDHPQFRPNRGSRAALERHHRDAAGPWHRIEVRCSMQRAPAGTGLIILRKGRCGASDTAVC